MRTAVVLFTRDLRVHDHPALAGACAAADRVVPLFVCDPVLLGRSPNRDRFLGQCLSDLRDSLRARGADLVVRRGDPVAEAIRVARAVGAEGIAASADVSRYARRREARLRTEAERHRLGVRLFPGITVVDPGAVTPAGGDHYKVFTPYLRAWQGLPWRAKVAAPRRIAMPDGAAELSSGLPEPARGDSPGAVVGGERVALNALRDWLDRVHAYADRHDDLAVSGTSRLSPYLRFGCVSPLAVARAAANHGGGGARAFVRQLCWRDFYHQLALAFPDLAVKAYRPSADETWVDDADALAAWREGRTGVPIVDAGMRQLRAEGWMHNRARLITASFLTKNIGLDWRAGGQEYARWLLDGDLPNNFGNWQWVAGTGTDARPYRRFNPVRQAHRFDPDGAYVRRYVPELSGVAGGALHQPWKLPEPIRRALRYESGSDFLPRSA